MPITATRTGRLEGSGSIFPCGVALIVQPRGTKNAIRISGSAGVLIQILLQQYGRRSPVHPPLVPAGLSPNCSQSVFRFKTRKPLINHFNRDREISPNIFCERPRARRTRSFAAIHVQRQPDDDALNVLLLDRFPNAPDQLNLGFGRKRFVGRGDLSEWIGECRADSNRSPVEGKDARHRA